MVVVEGMVVAQLVAVVVCVLRALQFLAIRQMLVLVPEQVPLLSISFCL